MPQLYRRSKPLTSIPVWRRILVGGEITVAGKSRLPPVVAITADMQPSPSSPQPRALPCLRLAVAVSSNIGTAQPASTNATWSGISSRPPSSKSLNDERPRANSEAFVFGRVRLTNAVALTNKATAVDLAYRALASKLPAGRPRTSRPMLTRTIREHLALACAKALQHAKLTHAQDWTFWTVITSCKTTPQLGPGRHRDVASLAKICLAALLHI